MGILSAGFAEGEPAVELWKCCRRAGAEPPAGTGARSAAAAARLRPGSLRAASRAHRGRAGLAFYSADRILDALISFFPFLSSPPFPPFFAFPPSFFAFTLLFCFSPFFFASPLLLPFPSSFFSLSFFSL